jgi:hypothetical protein
MDILRHKCQLKDRHQPSPTMQIWEMPKQTNTLGSCDKKKILHQIILAKKDDVKSAYCQMHLHHETAVKTVTQIPELIWPS